jgi:hypothetical protein
MHLLEAAILRTVLYADVFQFPLSLTELHYYLIHDEPVSLEAIQNTLQHSPYLQALLCLDAGYIALLDNSHIIPMRQKRDQLAQQLQPIAARYGKWLANIPFVRMVALTGALAARNPAHEKDDFDYLLVTQPGRVWLARAMAILVVRIVRRRGRELCPNYILAADNLVQERQDLYIARELAQMLPLYGYPLFEEMHRVNHWMTTFFPNAVSPRQASPDHHNVVKSWLEFVLGGKVGDWLEQWEYQRKKARFEQMAAQPQAHAQVDSQRVKGHFQDHGQRIMKLYEEKLQAYGLEKIHI